MKSNDDPNEPKVLTEDDVLNIINKHLSIQFNSYSDWYDQGVEVSICLGSEVISSSRFTLEKCRHTCSDSNPW